MTSQTNLKKKKQSSPRRSPSKKSTKKTLSPKTSTAQALDKMQKAYFCVPTGELNLSHCMINHVGFEVMLIKPSGQIAFANGVALAVLGCSQAEISKKYFMDFFKEKKGVRKWQKDKFLELKRKKKPVSYVIERVVKKGKVQTVEVSSTYLWRESGEYLLVVAQDITEQVASQNRLKESQGRYRLLSEQAAEGILLVSVEGVILYANKVVGQLFKEAPSKLKGMNFKKYIAKASKETAWKHFHKLMKGVSVANDELDIVDKRGHTVAIEFTASPISAGKKITQFHVIIRDMREKKEMESLVRESEKMKALQHFIAGTTHEIQQPLKALLDRSQSLIGKYEDRQFEYIGYKEFKDIMRTLRTMHAQMKYCFDTTDRLLSLSRRKANLQDNHCSVNSVIREAANMLKHSLEVSDIKVKLSLSSRLPHGAIGSLDLEQALNNVLTNAIQSLPGGSGKIQIKTTYQKAADIVRIDCKDDGVGIPKDVLARVFEPFFTTKPRGLEKSSGLGLSIVYSIIKAYQGEILVKSNYRQGALVTILLPVHKTKKPQ